MPKRLSILSLCLILGLWTTQPASAQALIPHAPQVDFDKLEQQGLGLVQEASQLAQFNQNQLALARARLAVQLAPKRPEAWAILGGLYLETNRADEAIPTLKKANSLDPKNAAILFALGTAHFQKAQYEESIKQIQAGLKIKPDLPGAYFDMGNAYLMSKKSGDAIASYEKAIARDKTFWPAINNIGLVRYEEGKTDEAIRLWRQSVAIDPKQTTEPQLAIAVALFRKGNQTEAFTLGEAALKTDARYGETKFLKDNLWGEKLLADTQKFFAVPRIQAAIAQAQAAQAAQEQRPSQ
ncbi:MAG: tetratricopeptide repeat protein [Plectolyngbya sp. WJT66-NPBG17]|nr:tetratricopeptide repeat protein [Plectolyngbya sp. WJT66-NPBG17]MBW4524459.1 tetratricopeptide repeat protein [Phormidium tanganyikae FI6-MK23]